MVERVAWVEEGRGVQMEEDVGGGEALRRAPAAQSGTGTVRTDQMSLTLSLSPQRDLKP